MRLIDADALLSELGECPYNWTDTEREVQEVNDWEMFRNMIDNAPTVQAKGDPISRLDVLNMIIVAGECEPDLGYTHLHKVVENIPSAEPKTGKWVWSDEDASWKCGRCDCVFEEIDWKPNYNFCPNCGARMYKGGEEDDSD